MKFLRNRCLECITVLVVCILMGEVSLPIMFSEANAAQFKVFEHTYIRQEGVPEMEIFDFSVLNSQITWTLQAFNGGMQDGETEYEMVSSATLNVNGLEVLRTNQFNQNTSYIEEVLTLSSNNTISTELRSKPGGCLMVTIVGEDDQLPTALWQSPADNQLFRTQQLTANLIVADDVSGLNPQTLSITDNGSDITDQFNPFTEPTLRYDLQAELELTEGEHTLLAQVADLTGESVQSALNITVDISSPEISDFFPQDGEVLTNAFPAITATLSDAVSAVDPDSIQLFLDGVNITSLANVTPDFIEYIPTEALSDGAHTVNLSVSDIAGNVANKNVGFSIETYFEEPPVISPESGFVHGKVLDSATDSPLSRVIVSIYGVSGGVYTNSEGKFSFPTPNTGEYVLRFEKDGYIVSERRLRVISTRDASVGDVYMKQLDPVVTTITNEGGLHQNSAGTLQLNFPPNALPLGVDSIDVQATLYEKGRELPSPLPRSSLFTYAFKVLPDKVNFYQPVSGRLSNNLGFAPGTEIPIGYYDPDKHKWEDIGANGTVSADGAWVDFEISHFCTYDINLPPTFKTTTQVANLTQANNNKSANCAKIFGTSVVYLKSGELVQEHSLPFYQMLNKAVDLKLTYNSRSAQPAVLLSIDAFNDNRTTAPDTTSLKFFLEGRTEEVFYKGIQGKSRMSYLFDGLNARGEPLDTGSYPYKFEISNTYTDVTYGTADSFGGPATGDTGVIAREPVPFTNTVADRICINNQQDSPFGSGWNLSGLQRLYFDENNIISVTEGDGSIFSFEKQYGALKQHLAILNFSYGGVNISLNNGDGTFQTPLECKTYNPARSLTSADFNNDGYSDLVLGNAYRDSVSIICGNGNGTFQPALTFSAGGYVVSPVTGDFNQDGSTDLAICNRSTNSISVLINKGDATFEAPVSYGSISDLSSITVGDFNQDGILDLAGSSLGYRQGVVIHFGNGDGTFQSGLRSPQLWSYFTKIIADDFNQDGLTDLALLYNRGSRGIILLNNGTDMFSKVIYYPVMSWYDDINLSDFISGDFDQNGTADLAVVYHNPDRVAIICNNGDETFQAPITYNVGPLPQQITKGDFNLDGILDLAMNHYGEDEVYMLFGNGDGTFKPSEIIKTFNTVFGIEAFDLIFDSGDNWFPKNSYVSLNSDYTYILENPDGTFSRFYKNGTEIRFNVQGLQTQGIDRNNNIAIYDYVDADNDEETDELALITLPTGEQYSLHYNSSGKLTSITDPSMRMTYFDIDSQGDLREISNPDNSIRKFSYDQQHLMIQKIDERGFVTEYDYDEYAMIEQIRSPQRQVSVVDQNGMVTTTLLTETRDYIPSEGQHLINELPAGLGTWDNPAEAVDHQSVNETFVDAKSNTWAFKTNKYGGRLGFTDPLNNTISYERDANSNLTKLTRANQSIQRINYDTRGNPVLIKEEFNGAATKIKYDLRFNQPIGIEDAKGNKTYIEYDDKGNPVEITDAKGVITQIEYNSRGQALRVINAFGMPEQSQTLFEYDLVTFNLIKVIDPLARETVYAYDAAGNIISITDALQNTAGFTYDVMGRIETAIDAEGHVATYEYYPGGYLKSITDANHQTTSYYYDEQGQLIKSVNAVGNEKTFSYDINRNLSQVITANGDTIKFYYDEANLLRTKFLPNEQIAYDYDGVYNLIDISDDDSSLSFDYDPLSRLVAARTNFGFSFVQPQTSISYTYDLNNNLLNRNDPQGALTQYVYDDLNLLTSIEDENDNVLASFDYDSLNRRIGKEIPAGFLQTFSSAYTYDKASQLLNLTHQPLNLSYHYTYDNAGNRSSMNDLFGTHSYDYDNLYRLTTANHPNITDENYSYDALGNRNPLQNNYDAANCLLEDAGYTYTYDDNGNMTSRRKKSTAEVTAYFYNSEDQLISVNTPNMNASYSYDALGRRIEKNVNGQITRYVYDGEDIVAEYNGNSTLVAKYMHGPGVDEPLILEESGQMYYYHSDGLGSIIAITDRNNNVVQSYSYDSFGNIASSSGSLTQPYTYTGRELDLETNLYYYRARYYNSSIGRFLQTDPVWSTNLYSYVNNDPINFIDPMGREIRVYSSPGWGLVGRIFGLRHAYVWSTITKKGRGMNGSSRNNRGNDGVGNPEKNGNYSVVDLKGRCEEDVIELIRKYPDWEEGVWIPWFNDCHKQLEDAFAFAGVEYPGAPYGRIYWWDDMLKDIWGN